MTQHKALLLLLQTSESHTCGWFCLSLTSAAADDDELAVSARTKDNATNIVTNANNKTKIDNNGHLQQ